LLIVDLTKDFAGLWTIGGISRKASVGIRWNDNLYSLA